MRFKFSPSKVKSPRSQKNNLVNSWLPSVIKYRANLDFKSFNSCCVCVCETETARERERERADILFLKGKRTLYMIKVKFEPN